GRAEPVLLRVIDPDAPPEQSVAGEGAPPAGTDAPTDVAGAAAAAVLGRLTADDGGTTRRVIPDDAADRADPVDEIDRDDDLDVEDGASDARYPLPSPTSFSALSDRLPDATVDPEGAARDGVEDGSAGPVGPGPTGAASTVAGRMAGLTPSVDARTRGVAVHALLEERLAPPGGHMTVSGPVDVRPPSHDAVRRAIGAADRHARPSDVEVDEIATTVAALLSGPTGRAIVRERRRRAVELPILVQLDGDRPLVQGYIDLWLRDPDHTVTVVDWKTNRLDPGVTPAEVVEHGYHLQRAVYALAALEHGAPKVQVVFAFSAAPDRPVLAAYGPTDRDRLRAEVVDAVDRAQRIPPSV
ncbi:MAG: PD-(D/E)XK nuclease family protein, partial [Solirubrobacteraceae bacterium]